MRAINDGRRALRGGLAGVCALALTLGVVRCAGPEQAHAPGSEGAVSSVTPASPARALHATPAFDLDAVMARAHFAFRAEAGALIVRDRTYSVRANATSGAIEVAPHGATGSAGAPARLETLDDAPDAVPHVVDDGALRIPRASGAVERLHATAAGLEQSWEVAARPEAGKGIAVRVRVTGQRFAGASASGLHFVDDATGLGLRYGNATWVDARGARTDVNARLEGDVITMTVPANVAARSAYPAALDPTVSPELGIDAPIPGTATGTKLGVTVATDGAGFFVVWSDGREGGSNADVFATRVDAAGTLLDPTGLFVGRGFGAPHAVFHDGNYVVVWGNLHARVDTSGKVLDPDGVAMWTTPDTSADAIAFDGKNELVACVKCGYLARVAPSGKLLSTVA